MEGHTETASGVWTTPECPFRVEYVPRVLDDIRLAVVDAFFSLPRGGAEIGGILLGSHGDGRVTIAGHQALDCEHAFGPSFTLSAHDRGLLAENLAAPRPFDLRPVGWYHSHTRSEIFLSEADLEIYNAYFAEQWQVALVIKPHTFRPARAGFFFRAEGGEIHRSGSYLEFSLEALAVRPLPAGPTLVEKHARGAESRAAAAAAGLSLPAHTIAVQPERVAEVAVVPPVSASPAPVVVVNEPKAPAVVVSEPEPQRPQEEIPGLDARAIPELEIPDFLKQAPRRALPRWVKFAAPPACILAIALTVYVTRQAWAPQLSAVLGRIHGSTAGTVSAPQPLTLGLNTLDSDGQLQIRWDGNSAAVRNAASALLEILDSNSAPRAIPLGAANLRSGSFTYARAGEKVDVVLVIEQSNGKEARESTTFLGRPRSNPEDAEALRKQRDELTKQNARLETDLKNANERNRKLQKSLSDARELLRIRQRLTNQTPK